jgi:hypothetical protein
MRQFSRSEALVEDNASNLYAALQHWPSVTKKENMQGLQSV